MTEAKKHKVKILWGSGGQGGVNEYEFDTLEELNAFLLGVDESSGWMDYEQSDPGDANYETFGEEEDDARL